MSNLAVAADIPGTNNSYVRNLKEGEDVETVKAEQAKKYPGYKIRVIGEQSFDSDTRDAAYQVPGY